LATTAPAGAADANLTDPFLRDNADIFLVAPGLVRAAS
jgi:hypothetical protein